MDETIVECVCDSLCLSLMTSINSIAPLERTKILLQVQGMRATEASAVKYRGIVHTMTTVVKEEGFLALYKGNGANVARVVPNYSLKFMFNDVINELFKKPGQKRSEMAFGQLLGAGTLAGEFFASLSFSSFSLSL